ncbi:MAG: 6-phosphogluconolactonase [Spiribacter sp.]|nr:6-phosphogluconolactonase [Spiribacter sp.]MDR9489660.1 6-phosphogluconolactonase [Spiribacter sp.]
MSTDNVMDTAQRFSTPQQAALALAERVRDVIELAVESRGRASLLVPGGTTPIPMFNALSKMDLPWASVYVSLTDERRVADDSPHSNARLVRTELMQNQAAHGHFYPLHRNNTDDRADEAAGGAALGMLPRPFDAVILGMGEDGHTASLFPHDNDLARALDLKTQARCLTTTAPEPPRQRLSLTLATLLDSRWMALLLSGQKKCQVLTQAITSKDSQRFPVQAILDQKKVPIHVYWSP